ncbi:hypothetical protein VN12_26205 [Pirellula sp. SH-Sr6A]|nr:hypothetical protein VN12_26205 [Pirellula sp. SH-Sr6A]
MPAIKGYPSCVDWCFFRGSKERKIQRKECSIVRVFFACSSIAVFCLSAHAQSGMDRFKELAIESHSTSLPCKISFEITVVTGEPGDVPDGKVMLGTAVSDGKGAKRVDYCEKSIESESSIPIIWHSLYISPKEYFAAVQSRTQSSVHILSKNESNPYAVNLSRIDPFDLVANPLGAVQKRQTPSQWERDSKIARQLENAEGNDAL